MNAPHVDVGHSRVKRRTFLLAGLGASGALLLGWSVLPPGQRLYRASRESPLGGGVLLNGWVAIGADDRVTVIVPKAEMGQGVHTALAMMLAEELDCAWEQVRIEQSPIDAIYANLTVGRDALPFHPDERGVISRSVSWYSDKLLRNVGLMITGGSTSVRDLWNPVRDAGGLARATLVDAAATEWGVSRAQCRVENGVIRAGDRSMRFGEVVASGRTLPPATTWNLKEPSAYRLIGTPRCRRSWRRRRAEHAAFGLDVRPAGLVYAAVTMSPTIGGRVGGFDAAAAKALRGVREVVELTGRNGGAPGVAVIAERWTVATKAIGALNVQWHAGPESTLSSQQVHDTLRTRAVEPGGRTFRRVGNVDESLASAAAVIEATYDVPYLAHTTMEPPNCTILARADGAEVWVGTQVPTQARGAVAEVLGVPAESVNVHVQLLGGGFGRRLEVDFIGQAAEIARAMPGVPVQVIWTREDDVQHDFYRPACVSVLRGGLDAAGRVVALHAVNASQPIVPAYGARNGVALARFDVHKSSVEGLFDQPYAFPAMRVSHHAVSLPVPIGYWRAVGHSHNAFFLESFVDELAFAAQQDPVAFRRALLSDHARARRVLELAAERSGWSTTPSTAADGARVARGVALHRSFGSICAQVAEVSLSSAREIRVHRVTCAVDCGVAINPDGIAQQMESGVVYGLTAALYSEITIDRGQVQQRNFDGYRALRIGECPVVDTFIVPSNDAPGGIGEVGLPPIAPAVANAVFALTGERLRSLPLRLSKATS